MSVAHTRDVLARCPILHRKRSLIDHLPSSRCNHVASQEAVCLLVTQNLHHSIDIGICSCTTICGKRELSNLVSYTLKNKQQRMEN